MDDKEYDISDYSDEELYRVLDLNHPSDRELEAQIIQYMAKYEDQGTEDAKKLHKFFEDVYDHFFQGSEEEEEEEDPVQENFENMTSTTENAAVTSNVTTETESSKGTKPFGSENTRPTYTSVYQFGPSSINPLLKETMKRIIFIDSQFRDYSLYPNSTSFKFNLSEPLSNVVSIKLHSVSIPYTWYNISNLYDANYFILEGNKIGMDGKQVRITIPPGTYNVGELLDALNQGIADAQTANPDVDFGTSKIIYSSTSNRIQFQWDITYTAPDSTKYYTKDFTLVFYKANGDASKQNGEYDSIVWNVTLGWILGYRNFASYNLDPDSPNNASFVSQNIYVYDSFTNLVTLVANTCLDLNTTKTLYLILNDHTNHHLNDGLVTIEPLDTKVAYPSYINSAEITQGSDGSINTSTNSNIPNQNLTANQTYAANEVIYNNIQGGSNCSIYSNPPNLNDMFAIIPIKLGGLQPGQLYTEFGGGLLENSRIYFGPVNLRKFEVKLMNDKGDVIELNNNDWNFSLVVEYLYNYNRT
jgi:hypothetical protein